MGSINQSKVDFTPRECEICLMVMAGILKRDMPKNSKMSYNTIKTHLADIFQKTHTKCCHQLVLWLVLHDWEVTMPKN
jgi:DNA-binding CsgD family transcriptional regulator